MISRSGKSVDARLKTELLLLPTGLKRWQVGTEWSLLVGTHSESEQLDGHQCLFFFFLFMHSNQASS